MSACLPSVPSQTTGSAKAGWADRSSQEGACLAGMHALYCGQPAATTPQESFPEAWLLLARDWRSQGFQLPLGGRPSQLQLGSPEARSLFQVIKSAQASQFGGWGGGGEILQMPVLSSSVSKQKHVTLHTD